MRQTRRSLADFLCETEGMAHRALYLFTSSVFTSHVLFGCTFCSLFDNYCCHKRQREYFFKKAPTGAKAKRPKKAKNNNSCRLLDESPNGFLKEAAADEEEEEEKTARPRKETKLNCYKLHHITIKQWSVRLTDQQTNLTEQTNKRMTRTNDPKQSD